MSSIDSVALVTNPEQHQAISAWHSHTGNPTSTYYELDAFLESLSVSSCYKLVLIGWDSSHPVESCTALRKIMSMLDYSSYVAILSTSNEESDIVTALDLGADRFVSINQSYNIVNARLQALVRPLSAESRIQKFEPFSFNLMNREVTAGGTVVQLTPGEFRIAKYLFDNQDRILTRETMLREIWGLPNLQYNRRVDTKLSHIRRKMQLDGTFGWSLEYPRGQGYQLVQTESKTVT